MKPTYFDLTVTDLDTARHCGGRIVEPKMPIPGIGWDATCAEPGGLRSGLIQPAADVGEGG